MSDDYNYIIIVIENECGKITEFVVKIRNQWIPLPDNKIYIV